MADKGHAHLAVGHQFRFMGVASSRSDRGAAHQTAELPGAPAKRTILQGIL